MIKVCPSTSRGSEVIHQNKELFFEIFTSRYETATANSFSSLASSMRLKSSFIVRYMTPGSFCVPNMVCVLPAPVAPYAKTEIKIRVS